MNPVELAKKIDAIIVDYDLNTAHTALEIAKLLVTHRHTAGQEFVQEEIRKECERLERPSTAR